MNDVEVICYTVALCNGIWAFAWFCVSYIRTRGQG
jgi:hypothetical protein